MSLQVPNQSLALRSNSSFSFAAPTQSLVKCGIIVGELPKIPNRVRALARVIQNADPFQFPGLHDPENGELSEEAVKGILRDLGVDLSDDEKRVFPVALRECRRTLWRATVYGRSKKYSSGSSSSSDPFSPEPAVQNISKILGLCNDVDTEASFAGAALGSIPESVLSAYMVFTHVSALEPEFATQPVLLRLYEKVVEPLQKMHAIIREHNMYQTRRQAVFSTQEVDEIAVQNEKLKLLIDHLEKITHALLSFEPPQTLGGNAAAATGTGSFFGSDSKGASFALQTHAEKVRKREEKAQAENKKRTQEANRLIRSSRVIGGPTPPSPITVSTSSRSLSVVSSSSPSASRRLSSALDFQITDATSVNLERSALGFSVNNVAPPKAARRSVTSAGFNHRSGSVGGLVGEGGGEEEEEASSSIHRFGGVNEKSPPKRRDSNPVPIDTTRNFSAERMFEDMLMREIWCDCFGDRTPAILAGEGEEEFQQFLSHFPPWSRKILGSFFDLFNHGIVSVWSVNQVLEFWGPAPILPFRLAQDLQKKVSFLIGATPKQLYRHISSYTTAKERVALALAASSSNNNITPSASSSNNLTTTTGDSTSAGGGMPPPSLSPSAVITSSSSSSSADMSSPIATQNEEAITSSTFSTGKGVFAMSFASLDEPILSISVKTRRKEGTLRTRTMEMRKVDGVWRIEGVTVKSSAFGGLGGYENISAAITAFPFLFEEPIGTAFSHQDITPQFASSSSPTSPTSSSSSFHAGFGSVNTLLGNPSSSSSSAAATTKRVSERRREGEDYDDEDENSPRFSESTSMLHRAAYCCDVPLVRKLLQSGSEGVLTFPEPDEIITGGENWTPLLYASVTPISRAHEVMELLTSAAARRLQLVGVGGGRDELVSFTDTNGRTALYYSIINRQAGAVAHLLQCKPDLKASSSTIAPLFVATGAHWLHPDINDIHQFASVKISSEVIRAILYNSDPHMYSREDLLMVLDILRVKETACDLEYANSYTTSQSPSATLASSMMMASASASASSSTQLHHHHHHHQHQQRHDGEKEENNNSSPTSESSSSIPHLSSSSPSPPPSLTKRAPKREASPTAAARLFEKQHGGGGVSNNNNNTPSAEDLSASGVEVYAGVRARQVHRGEVNNDEGEEQEQEKQQEKEEKKSERRGDENQEKVTSSNKNKKQPHPPSRSSSNNKSNNNNNSPSRFLKRQNQIFNAFKERHETIWKSNSSLITAEQRKRCVTSIVAHGAMMRKERDGIAELYRARCVVQNFIFFLSLQDISKAILPAPPPGSSARASSLYYASEAAPALKKTKSGRRLSRAGSLANSMMASSMTMGPSGYSSAAFLARESKKHHHSSSMMMSSPYGSFNAGGGIRNSSSSVGSHRQTSSSGVASSYQAFSFTMVEEEGSFNKLYKDETMITYSPGGDGSSLENTINNATAFPTASSFKLDREKEKGGEKRDESSLPVLKSGTSNKSLLSVLPATSSSGGGGSGSNLSTPQASFAPSNGSFTGNETMVATNLSRLPSAHK